MRITQSTRQQDPDTWVEVDGKRYRPGQLVSMEDVPQRYTTGGWA